MCFVIVCWNNKDLQARFVNLQQVLSTASLPLGTTIPDISRQQSIDHAWVRLEEAIFPCEKILITAMHLSQAEKNYFMQYAQTLDAVVRKHGQDSVQNLQALEDVAESYKGFTKKLMEMAQPEAELRLSGDNIFLGWPQAKVDAIGEGEARATSATKQASMPSSANWNKPADLFWLGSDLETTAQTALRGAPKERILHGLTQCFHHISELGLGDSAPGKELFSLKSQAATLPENALDRQWRNDFAEKTHSIIHAVSGLARGQQPDFRPYPEQK